MTNSRHGGAPLLRHPTPASHASKGRNPFGHVMPYSVPFGQVMLYGPAPSQTKPPCAGHVMLYSPAKLC